MVTSVGSKKVKTAVFISGTGSNLKSLIKFSHQKKSPISIQLIISNDPKAKGLKLGNFYQIKKKVFSLNGNNLDEKKTILELNKNKIDLICLAGFMKILSKNFIKNFKGKILNIHPSLLPKFKGLHTHKRVLKSKQKITGCTVHFVNAKLDSGKIILQKKVNITKKDNEKTLTKKVLNQEHKLYPRAILKLFNP